MALLLDADVFIEAKKRYYGLDFCPAFWDWIGEQHAKKYLYSIQKVREEIFAFGKEDELKKWAKLQTSDFFLPANGDVTDAMSAVSDWATKQSYTHSAVSDFLNKADYYLVAHAVATNEHTIVTHEASRNKTSQIKIPDACTAFNIKCISTFDMLRNSGAVFSLKRCKC